MEQILMVCSHLILLHRKNLVTNLRSEHLQWHTVLQSFIDPVRLQAAESTLPGWCGAVAPELDAGCCSVLCTRRILQQPAILVDVALLQARRHVLDRDLRCAVLYFALNLFASTRTVAG
jgi:hypothetical protein